MLDDISSPQRLLLSFDLFFPMLNLCEDDVAMWNGYLFLPVEVACLKSQVKSS